MKLRLKELRKKKGMKLHQLASVIGVSSVTISRYENGEREPSLMTLKKLADFFEVPIEYLLGIIDDSELQELKDQEKYIVDNKEFIEKDFELLTTLLTYGVPKSEIEFKDNLDVKKKDSIIFLMNLLFLRIGNDINEKNYDFYDKLLHAVNRPADNIKIID